MGAYQASSFIGQVIIMVNIGFAVPFKDLFWWVIRTESVEDGRAAGREVTFERLEETIHLFVINQVLEDAEGGDDQVKFLSQVQLGDIADIYLCSFLSNPRFLYFCLAYT